MRRERPPELLRDILDFIGKIDSWAPAQGEAIDEKTLYAVLHAPTRNNPDAGYM